MIKLIATDMDGTLLNSKKELPPDFIGWVRDHPDIKVVIASGRQYYNLKVQFGEVSERLIYIAENGGLAFEGSELLYTNAMKKENILRCLDVADKVDGVTPILCGAKAAYMEHESEVAERNAHMYYYRLDFVDDLRSCIDNDVIVKIALFIDDDKAEETYSQVCNLGGEITAVVSGREWIDVGNAGVNKGGALRAVQEKYGIDIAETMGFGDYMNDYEMLKVCGESYAMANACEGIANLAKHKTLSNDEGGVMAVLRTM